MLGDSDAYNKVLFCHPISSITVGVSRAVRMPLRVRPRLAYAPTNWSRSIAADVPSACEAAPMDRPRAIGLLTRPMDRVLKPIIAPISPVITTMAAVSEGIPPSTCVTSMAIGVVTDLLASDRTTASDAPNTLEMTTTLTMPTMQPTVCEANIGRNWLLMEESWRYSGTPRATTAGFSQNAIILAPSLYVS